MNEAMRYRVSDTKRKRKLRRYSRLTAPEDLTGELAAMRLLAAEAIDLGQTTTANLILSGIGKMASEQIKVKKLRGEYIERSTVNQLLNSICETLANTLKAHAIPQWEEILDEISSRLSAAVENQGDCL